MASTKQCRVTSSSILLLAILALLPVADLSGQQASTPASEAATQNPVTVPQPVTWTAAEDHQNMMNQLGIKALRPGPSGNESAPNHANYDESKADPFPDLPDVLTLKNGQKVTTVKIPPVNVGLLDGELAWRQHDGGHTDGPNWRCFITWADKFFNRNAAQAAAAAPEAAPPAAGGRASPKVTPEPPAGGASSAASAGWTSRWLDLQAGNLALDDKIAEPTASPWYYQLQYRFLTRGRFKFDEKGRYAAGFRLSTGDLFSFSWNNTGAGAGDFQADLYLKELYLSASPWKSIEFQFGGIGVNRGESTEITSYSNNGYLTGERVSIRCPEKLFFDEISATGAYLGDLDKPGIFQRFHRLSQMNYQQYLVVKKIGKHLSVSADYTSQDGVATLRQAVKVSVAKNRIIDTLVFENYQRLEVQPAWGCALSAQKNPTRQLALTGGYADVDGNYPYMNSDRMGKGRRVYAVVTYNFWREFSAGFYATKAFANDFYVRNATRFDLILQYDFVKALQKAHTH